MASDWELLTVDEIKAPGARSIAIGPFGSRMKADTYVPSGVPVIRGTNISDTRAFSGDFVFVSEDLADSLRSCNVHADDLVFPHRGAIGEVAIVPADGFGRYMLSTSLMKLTCDKQRVDPRFVFYFFRSEAGRHALLQNASTVGTPGIGQPLTSLRSIKIPVPPMAEQRRIAHILGTLDDKIELNRRMNETLEEMARALFKSWFVDFDPVRAKAENRDSGLPKHLADLFPDHLVDSELGPIPEGWSMVPFSETVSVASGGTPKTSEPDYWSGDIPWFSVADTPAQSDVWVTRTQKTVSQAGLDSSAASVMPKGTTILSARGTVGNVALAARAMSFNQSCYGFPVRLRELGYFTYFATLNIVDSLQRRAHGSVFSTITRATLDSIAVTSIPPQGRAAFEAVTAPVMERILAANLESEALAKSRDGLLKVLLASGEHSEHDGGVHT